MKKILILRDFSHDRIYVKNHMDDDLSIYRYEWNCEKEVKMLKFERSYFHFHLIHSLKDLYERCDICEVMQ